MDKPSQQALREATGISQSYASMIANGVRAPARPLAIHIFRRTGWKHPVIADLTDEQIDVLETIEPWVPASERSTDTAEGAAA